MPALRHRHPRTEDIRLDPADAPDIFDQGRTCPEPGCITSLSAYNPGPKCYAHSPRKSRLIETVEELREMMES